MGYGGIDVDDLNEARAERDALRAQLAEVTRERDALGESLTTLVYWHDHGGIDASWWTDARELLSAHAKASGGES